MDNASDDTRPTLFIHKKRREWGRALLVWERNEKRGYLFEDGQEKVMARGFYGLMEEIEVSAEELAALQKRLGVTPDRSVSRSASKPSLTFPEQLQVFRTLYPQGFQGDAWQAKFRGAEGVRRIKRHRTAAIVEVQQRLEHKKVSALLHQQQHEKFWHMAAEVLCHTDLVPTAVSGKLQAVNAEQARLLAQNLADLLHGPGPFEGRFDGFARSVKASLRLPSWQLVTAPLALLNPDEHFCVRPASLRDQVKQMAPGVTLERWPSSIQYNTLLALARQVREKLLAAEQAPRDLFDVYDFVRVTTSPSARRSLGARPQSPATDSTDAKAADEDIEAA